MKICFLFLVIFLFLFFSCNENKKLSAEKNTIESNTIEVEKLNLDSLKKDSIPTAVFQKIGEIPFVKKRFKELDEEGFKYYYMVDFDTSHFSKKHHLQVLVDTEFRAIPIFNFYYDPKTKELLILENIDNEDVWIPIE